MDYKASAVISIFVGDYKNKPYLRAQVLVVRKWAISEDHDLGCSEVERDVTQSTLEVILLLLDSEVKLVAVGLIGLLYLDGY